MHHRFLYKKAFFFITRFCIEGDSLTGTLSHNGQRFSTRDVDNDSWGGTCNPTYHKGGWWFSHCAESDLNGFYYSSAVDTTDSCHWISFHKRRTSLKNVYMMIRNVWNSFKISLNVTKYVIDSFFNTVNYTRCEKWNPFCVDIQCAFFNHVF